jgi:hypothetical protein
MAEINYFKFVALYSGDDWAVEVDSSHVERIG